MSRGRAEILLAAVIIARSSSFVFNKIGLGTMSAFNMLAVRFLAAFAGLLLIFGRGILKKLNRETVLCGALVGFIFFAIMSCEMFSLKTVPSGTVSLLENLAIILVPLLDALITQKRPRGLQLLCAGIALVGVALITLREGRITLGLGECIALCAAVLYACGIIAIDRTSHRCDGFTIGILEVGFLGTFALIASLLFETPRLPDTPGEWGIILMLAVVCTGFGYTLQPVAQSHTTAQRASVFCALSPAFAAVFGAIILHERMTPWGYVGIVLVLGSILLPHVPALEEKNTPEENELKYKTILFDMDGTVLDTVEDLTDAVNHTLNKWARPAVSTQQVVDATGNGARVLVAACLQRGMNDPDYEAIAEEYRKYYAAHSLIKTAPYPGTLEMLQKLQDRGVKVAIVSNKPHEAASALAQKLFPGIPTFGERSGIPKKPAADMVLHAIEQIGGDRDKALYVGDSEVDVATAKNSGLDCICVSWGFRGQEKLLQAAPDATVVDTWEEFLKVIR